MATLPTIQAAGACRSTPARPGSFLQSSCSHRVTPFTNRPRRWTKRTPIGKRAAWPHSAGHRTSTRTFAAAVEEPQPEEVADAADDGIDEAELLADDEEEIRAMREDEEFKPDVTHEVSEEQLNDRSFLLSTMAKSFETTAQPLTAEQDEEEQAASEAAARIVESGIELEKKFGVLRGPGESPLPFSDMEFWEEVEDDVNAIEMVENFDETKYTNTDPFVDFLVGNIPPKPLGGNEAFHNDPDIVALRNAKDPLQMPEFTEEEKAAMAMMEGEALEEYEEDSSPVLDAMIDVLGVPEAFTEEQQELLKQLQEKSSGLTDVNELLKDKDVATAVDMAALVSGLHQHPQELAYGVKWTANQFTMAADKTDDVLAEVLDTAQQAADDGVAKPEELNAVKELTQQLSAALEEDATAAPNLEAFLQAKEEALRAIGKDGIAEPLPLADTSALHKFFADNKDQLQQFEQMEQDLASVKLPDEFSEREQTVQMVVDFLSQVDDPELNAAAMVDDISVADAAAAKDLFLKEVQAVLSEEDFKSVSAYMQSAFLAKVRDSGDVADEDEIELPDFKFPEIEGLDVGDKEADAIQGDLNKEVAEIDDVDDSELDDFDEDVVKWRHLKYELLKTLGKEDGDEAIAGSVAAPSQYDAASLGSLKMVMRLIEDAAEGRPLLKDFVLEDSDLSGAIFPTLAEVVEKIKAGGDVEASIEDSPVLQELMPLLQQAIDEKPRPTPKLEIPLEDVDEDDMNFTPMPLDGPIESFILPMTNMEYVENEIQERKARKEALAEEMGVNDEAEYDDAEFEDDETEKDLLKPLEDAPTDQLVREWADTEGFVVLGPKEDELEAALAKAQAAADAFEASTAGVNDPSGLADEDYQNLKVAFENLYYVQAAMTPQAAELRQAAEKVRQTLLAHRFAEQIGDFVEHHVTRGHLEDLNAVQLDEEVIRAMDDDKVDEAFSDLLDKLEKVGEEKLAASVEEALKDSGLPDLDIPVEGAVPEDVADQFATAALEKLGAERVGELKAQAEIEEVLENPKLLELDIDPVELDKDEIDLADDFGELNLLEAEGLIQPLPADDPEELELKQMAAMVEQEPAEADAEAEEAEELAEGEEAQAALEDAPVQPPSQEGAILGELVDQVMDSLRKVEEDELYVDDEVYEDEAAGAEASAEAQDEAEEEEDDTFDASAAEETAARGLGLVAQDEDEAEEDELLSSLVFTNAADREDGEEDDLDDEYGEEEGEGDVAPEDMRNEYNSFMSEELFGNPTFADIWEEMGIPEMRPKEPVRMEQEEYSTREQQVEEEEEDEDAARAPIAYDGEEGEEDLDSVPVGDWFGDDEEPAEVEAAAAGLEDDETSLEKLSKYYGGKASFEGLDKSESPRDDLDVFAGAKYLDGGDDDDRAADDTSGLMERVTMTKEGVVFIERVIQVQRVVKVVKGGNIMSFRCTAVVGNRSGIVGVGVGSAREVAKAVQKAVADAKKNVIMVPLTKYASIPHRVEKKFKASQCVINPAADGTGCIAGGAIRSVLELAGVKNCLAKQLGSRNPMNNARLTIEALRDLQTWGEVAAKRNVPMSYLFAQNQAEADRVLAEHRGAVDEETIL